MLERIVKFVPAYDKRDPSPSKNYGIHGVNLFMCVKGPKGCISFTVFTGWHTSQVREEYKNRPEAFSVLPADVSYHSYEPQWEGQEVSRKECDWLDNKPCYSDGSGLEAKAVFDLLTDNGEDAVWEYLENYYKREFGE